jgi:hypothetical protein
MAAVKQARKKKKTASPEAFVVHRTSDRIRIRIPSRKGDAAYFLSLAEDPKLKQRYPCIRTNPLTGSVLICSREIDVEVVAELAEERGFFAIRTGEQTSRYLAQDVGASLGRLNRQAASFLGIGDLAGIGFLSFLGMGFYQILRGRLVLPPWYTAFWYAFGIWGLLKVAENLSGRELR